MARVRGPPEAARAILDAGAWLILGAILALPLTAAGVALVSALCR